MEWMLLAISVVAFFGWIELSRRLKDAEQQIRRFETRLERVEYRDKPAAPATKPEPVQVTRPVKPQPEPEPPSAFIPKIVEPVVVRIPEPPAPPAPTLGDRIRKKIGDTEWEAFVGTSLLNKVGALVLVMGIALFLSYSFGHVGPMGRAIAAILGSLGLLAGGIWAESRSRFRVFARGLIGAGWAGLYATAYAIYAVPATKIIGNPIAGSIILFAVACGMIAHSLRYRAEGITAVTYFAAFGALAISPLTPFAVLSLIPLAASLLYLAHRFQWFRMAVLGVAATYLTCISRGDSHAPLAASQTLMLAFWILFETFDLMRMRRRLRGGGLEWISAANALGFIGISYHAWATHAPDKLWLASACGAALYVASTAARFVVRRPSSFESSLPLRERLRGGSFEGSALVAAVLAGLAIFGRSQGMWATAELLVEAEIVYLAGAFLGSAFLRGLGIGGFGVSLLQGAINSEGTGVTFLGHSFENWTPAAVLHAAAFYFNREVRRQGVIFSSLAGVMVAGVLGAELNPEWIGMGVAFFGGALLFAGLRRQIPEYRYQGMALAAIGFAATAYTAIAYTAWLPIAFCLALSYALAFSMERVAGRLPVRVAAGFVTVLAALLLRSIVPADYVTMSWALLMPLLLELQTRRVPEGLGKAYLAVAAACILSTAIGYPGPLEHHPRPAVWISLFAGCLSSLACVVRLAISKREEERDTLTLVTVAGVSTLLWMLAPLPTLSILWLAIGIGMLELSHRYRSAAFGWIGLGEAAAALCRVWLADLYTSDKAGQIPMVALTASVFIAGLYFLYTQVRGLGWHRTARVATWCAASLYVGATMAQAGSSHYGIWWAGGMVALLTAGRIFKQNDFRFQSYGLSGLMLAAVVLTNLMPVNLWISIPAVTALYAAWLISGRGDGKSSLYFSIAGTLLMGLVLYHAVSGSMLTVAWGMEGTALLCAGFWLRERVLRLQGLAIFLFCTLKLFLYDLRNLDTPYRIVSFIALGGILLGVSWTYSRFREQLRRIL